MRSTSSYQNVALPTRGDRPMVVLVAVVSLIVGTLSAVSLVPDTLYMPEALFWPSLVMTISLLLPMGLQLRLDLRSLLRVENLIMVGLVYWLMLDMLQSAYPFDIVTVSDVQLAFSLVGVFAICVWIGTLGRGWRLPRTVVSSAAFDPKDGVLFACLVFAFVLGIMKFAIGANFSPTLMLQGLGMPRFSAPWSRGQFGGWDAVADHLQYFGYILPSLTVMIAARRGWISGQALVGIWLSLVVLLFLAQGGGRRVIGVAVGAAVISWLATNPRLRPRLIISTILVLGLLLMAMQEMLRYRNVGFGASLERGEPQEKFERLHVDDNFLRLSQIIHFYPERIDYIFPQPFYHALMLPIPRVIWPGKPRDAGFDIAQTLGKQGVSLTSSILGELWVSFGFATVVIGGFLFGRLAGMWNKILWLSGGSSKAILYGLGLMAMFAGLRSMQALVQMSYIVLAWILITALFRNKPQGSSNYMSKPR